MTTDPPTDGTTATRREFLTGDWFESEAASNHAAGADPGSVRTGTDGPGTSRSQRLPARLAQLLRTVAVLGLVLLVLTSSVTPAMAAAQDDDSAGAATEAREDAMTLLAELEELDETESVDIDRTVIAAISDHIEQGNISFRNGEYSAAIESYDLASQQARAALESGYVERAQFLLNASQAQLTDLDRQGYATVRHQQLEARAAELSARVETVSGVREARQLERDAVALSSDVEALPDPALVRTVDQLHDGWPLVAAGALFVGGALLALGAWLRPRIESIVGDDPDEPGGLTTRVGSQAGHENRLDD